MLKKMSLIFGLAMVVFSCSGQEGSAKDGTVAKNVNVTEFETLINEGNGVLVDVRTDGEYAQSHIAGSKQIDISSSDFDTEILKLDKETPVYVYCKSGGRSGRAMSILRKNGFKEVYNLNGGITAWKNNNKPVE